MLLDWVQADRRQFEQVQPGVLAAHIPGVLHAELTADGLVAWAGDDELALRTVSVNGVELEPHQAIVGDCAPTSERVGARCAPAAELRCDGLTEWWTSAPDGVHQGWTLDGPTGDAVRLRVGFPIGALHSVDAGGQGATLVGSTGRLWRYEGLVAWDADGRWLDAQLLDDSGELIVSVDTRGAAWPVTIDPSLALEDTTRLTASDAAADEGFGYAVTGAGDVNGDGYDDVAVGAPGDSGSVYVYYGSATGISAAAETKLTASDSRSGGYFGITVAGAGDLNSDGYDDLVTASHWDDDNGELSGSAYVFFGAATGVSPSSEVKLVPSDSASFQQFGWSVAGAGDLDGDGFDDLAVGARGDGQHKGAVYVYAGSASGVSSAAVAKLRASDAADNALFGSSVSAAGDVNGDGYGDLVVGAIGDNTAGVVGGAAYVFYGSASGLASSAALKLVASDGTSSHYFGDAVTGAGDVNGDGYDDIAVSAIWDIDNGPRAGAVYVYTGGASGISGASELKIVASDGVDGQEFGSSLSAAGDVDGDGYSDLVVGGDLLDGSAYVYFGSATGLSAAAESILTTPLGAPSDNFGAAVASAGDVDGDGFDDLVVGAYRDGTFGAGAGAAYVLRGGCRVDDDGDGHCADADCDDSDAGVHPGAAEVVGDGVDQDCDGAEVCYADGDDDGHTDGLTTVLSADLDCDDVGEGLPSDPTGDCDDSDATVNPDGTEVCDDVDNDCDGTVDNDAADAGTWYTDGDDDGFGDPDTGGVACIAPEGTTDDATDCDDTDATVNPAATEVAGDGIDQDCDGADDQGAEGESATKDDDGGCSVGGSSRGGLGWLAGLVALVGLRRRRTAQP